MNDRHRPLIRTATALAATAGVLALSGCGGGTATGGQDGTQGGKLDVVASFYPMEFLAQEIGGEHASVTTLTEPGVEPHDLELSPQQTGQLGEADVVVYLKGLQPAVDEAVSQSGVPNVAEATSYTSPPEEQDAHETQGHGATAEEDHAEHSGEEHGEHGSTGDEEHGHAHGHDAGDPHVWLDPVTFAEVAEGVGKTLQKADPDHAADYRKNTEVLVEKLNALDAEFKEGLGDARTKTFITSHDAFGHLAQRYGLDQESIAGLDPASEPSAARMRQLHAVAKEEKVSTVFFETLVSDKTAKALAGDLGLKTEVLDPIEGIGDTSRGDDYFEVMRANLAALQKGLGAT